MNKKYLLISIVFFSIAFLSMFFVLGKMAGNRYLPIIERQDFEKEAELSEIITPEDEVSFYFIVNGQGPSDHDDNTEYLYKAIIKEGELKAYEASILIDKEINKKTFSFPNNVGDESIVIENAVDFLPYEFHSYTDEKSVTRQWYVSDENPSSITSSDGKKMYLTNKLFDFNSLHVKDLNNNDIKLTKGGINFYNRFSTYYGGTLPEQILSSGFLNDHLIYIQFPQYIGEHYKYKDCTFCKKYEDLGRQLGKQYDLNNYISKYVNIDRKDKLHWDGSIVIMDINTGKWNDSLIGSYIDIPSEYIDKNE